MPPVSRLNTTDVPLITIATITRRDADASASPKAHGAGSSVYIDALERVSGLHPPSEPSAPERLPRFVMPPAPRAARLGYAATIAQYLARYGSEAGRERLRTFLNGSDGPQAFLLAWGTLDVRAMDRVMLQVGEVAERLSPAAALSMAVQMYRSGIDDTDNQRAAFHALVRRSLGDDVNSAEAARALEVLSSEGIDYDPETQELRTRARCPLFG